MPKKRPDADRGVWHCEWCRKKFIHSRETRIGIVTMFGTTTFHCPECGRRDKLRHLDKKSVK